MAVLGKNIWGPGPLLFGRLSEITIEPINSTSSRTTVQKFGGGGAPWPQRRTATVLKLSPPKNPTLYSGPVSESIAVSDEQNGLKHR